MYSNASIDLDHIQQLSPRGEARVAILHDVIDGYPTPFDSDGAAHLIVDVDGHELQENSRQLACSSTVGKAPGRIILVTHVAGDMSRTVRISENERERLVADINPEFPKYTTQIINTANQNAQGTRPRVVGQMSDLIAEYREKYPDGDYEDWKEFYYEEYDGHGRIEDATDKVYEMVVKMRNATEGIDREMVNRWIRDLVLYKTYTGLGREEEAIFEKLAEEYGFPYRRSTAVEESKGIDGYLGEQPVSIKPITYQQKSRLQENIQAPIVYYEEYKTTDALKLHVGELDDAFN